MVENGRQLAAHERTATGVGLSALRSHGDLCALVVGDHVVSYRELADRAHRRMQELGVGRRLVALSATPALDTVVTLLAAIERQDAVMLVAPGAPAERLIAHYRPDVIAGGPPPDDASSPAVRHATPPTLPSAHELHPDLRLLLSTSGSAGAPKLVRLSLENVETNAVAIADYLGLGPTDRAITALPLYYCYGLSVVTSHLAVGASVVLTDLSIVDPCFADLVHRNGVTGLATVPHSFDLLDRTDRRLLQAPSLRYVTQAGGRLEPERVVALAREGHRLGWDFVVMYGQTEATARIAYLPPGEALRRPSSVGVAIPGGTLTLDLSACPDGRRGVGEIVYRGPNVMMGYAQRSDALSAAPALDELRTGDLGRFDDEGFLHVIGRVSRFVKLHGKRVDLDDLARSVADALGNRDEGEGPVCVVCAGDDDGVVVALVDPEPSDSRSVPGGECLDPDLHRLVSARVDVPPGRIIAIRAGNVPLTASGKLDNPALLEIGRGLVPGDVRRAAGDDSVHAVFRSTFGRDVPVDESFASLGGDSFSYVETSIQLETVLGELPADWHLQSIGDLEERRGERLDPGARRRSVQVETSVVLRAICIVLIVCTHMRLYRLPGGAHTLLAVVGYNFARFQLPAFQLDGRLRRAWSTIGRIAAPTSVWIGLNMALAGGYSLGALLLVNNYTGDAARRGGRWEYWYFEAFVQTMVVLALVFSIAAVRRTERRAPFTFALAVLAATLAIRFDVVQWGDDYNEMFRPHTVACFVALGWAGYAARVWWQRLVVTGLTVATTVGYFGQTDREWRIILFVTALIWLPSIRLPSRIAPLVTTVGAASMWIFLVHWQVWPLFTPLFERHLALAATVGVGVLVWWGYEQLRRAWTLPDRRVGRRQVRRRVVGRSTRSHVRQPDTATSTSDARPVSA